MKRFLFAVLVLLVFISSDTPIGTQIDALHGVPVYFNGKSANVHGRHIAKNGYNLGLKWQCVEFVKRYYYTIYDHKFPSSGGNAKDFFDKSLRDKDYNGKRGLLQIRNTREYPPQAGDILVYDGNEDNPYGHIAIISCVDDGTIEIVQQNWGKKTRHTMNLVEYKGIYTVADFDVLGWLRKP